ncbi:MAG: 5-(carboxyamino)imidazole ribonucleotide synthase [Cyanobacteria bacterium]|nr:5-(carboxyamino)imidazole ribonucleotide synthase [Cyanobacteriota bacterium]MDW8200162.1 5-(carboxyamino)imidazole ribonucleotide synthase [Cyanobacteriota bacterium SKYGB_h_bin112]
MHRVGVIGGGQLAWMMGMAAPSLSVELVVQTPHREDPAVVMAADVIIATIADAAATAQLATCCDVITFENEFVDITALSALAHQGICFRPSLDTLAPLLDKYDQRCYLRNLGLPVPAFFPVIDQQASALEYFTLPIVLKARRHGYDGQGTWIVHDQETWDKLLPTLATTPLLAEAYVPFERELAVIAARSTTGEILIYPLVETQQVNRICQRAIAPAAVDETVRQSATAIADNLLTALGAVGVFAIELFLTADGKLLVNEVAPRVHNSGHFSLDACITSQFAQHLRAVCGLPLGDPALKPGYAGAVMVNLLGYEAVNSDYLPQRQQLANIPYAHVYWYGKSESRPGRKLGHVTVLVPDRPGVNLQQATAEIITQVESIWYRQA